MSMHGAVCRDKHTLERSNICYSNYFSQDSKFPRLLIRSSSSDPSQFHADY